MKKTILALSVLTLVLASCKKDNKNEPTTPTKENLTGTYKLTAFTMTYNGISMDYFNTSMEACDKDDLYHLNADNSYALEDAGTVCSPSNSYTGGTWSLQNNTTINLDGQIATIKSWNGKTLVVEGNDSGTTISQTYVKQ
jgi:hypothetical protein